MMGMANHSVIQDIGAFVNLASAAAVAVAAVLKGREEKLY